MPLLRKFHITLLLLVTTCSILAQSGKSSKVVIPVVPDQLEPAYSANINGFVGEKLAVSYQNRILAQDVDRLVEPFRNHNETSCWQSEFWGKWATSAVLAYQYQPTPLLKEKLDRAVYDLIATQHADGYIGNYADGHHLESWDIWGRKYCMLGLLAYYDLTKQKVVLQAVRKVADHLIKELADRNEMIVRKGNHRGMAASSVLEPICLLYTRTGEKKYLDFAEEIVRQWETPDGPQLISKADVEVYRRFPKATRWFGWEQGQKAYEMMSCYEGLLELYRLTGKEEYRTAVEKTWESIFNNEINVTGSGSSVECWFRGKQLQTMPVHHYQETCVTATWIKMCQQLLRLTGEIKYADAIEQAYYNALLAAMKTDGSDWAKYTPLSGQRMEGTQQCDMGLNCCVASGPRGLFTFPLSTVMTTRDGLQVNFFADGLYKLESPSKQPVTLKQETSYPVDGKIVLELGIPKAEKMTLRIRIPSWSVQTMIKVNGEPVKEIIPGRYVIIQRVWNSHDRLEIDFDMRGRVITMGDQPENMAILYGPIVLARDARLQGPAVGAIIKPIFDENRFINLIPSEKNTHGIWMQFYVACMPESYAEEGPSPIQAEFCDYASAGNTYNENSFFRVWLPQLFNPAEE